MTLEDSVLRHRLAVMHPAAALDNVSQACREFGISRTLFYRWRRRLVRYGPDGLRPRPTRPTRWPRQATPALEHQVVAYALLWPTHGPARMAAHLRQPRWGGWQVSASGVYAILCRHGLRTRWERLTKLEAHSASTVGLLTERTRTYLRPPPVEAQRPGDLVCLDAFYVGKLTGVGKVWQLTACDAACSYALATVVPRVTAQAAVHFLRTHVVPIYQRAGHRIRTVLTDGGPDSRRPSPQPAKRGASSTDEPSRATPGRTGSSSRLQGTLLSELWRVAFRRTDDTSLGQLERDLQAYLRFHNREQPHLGYRLKGRTPAMAFRTRLESQSANT
ncbi:MAG: helix-turn-helix domain-containing protein [Armatimonadota bacterium]|nr:helix-turn-helix domain-containing protein [Armatimonadota bacterium]